MSENWLEIDARKRIGGFVLDARLTISDPRCSIFGSSAAGKSTLLRIVAGIDSPDEGRISLNGRVVFDSTAGINVPAHLRRAGLVFQHSALFPHMTVEQNLAFGIRDARRGDARVAAMASEMGLSDLLPAMPPTLSGGERQRVALARTLLSAPGCALLDEPLSSLDAPSRERVRSRALALLARSGTPILYVTHDLEEACMTGSELVVMGEGRIIQRGPPAEILRRPADPLVAELMAVRNLFDAALVSMEGDLARASAGPLDLVFPMEPGRPFSGPVKLGIRPEEVRILPRGSAASRPNRFAGKVTDHACAGARHHIVVVVGSGGDTAILRAYMPDHPFRHMALCLGAEVDVYIPPRCIHVIDSPVENTGQKGEGC